MLSHAGITFSLHLTESLYGAAGLQEQQCQLEENFAESRQTKERLSAEWGMVMV